jgi:hypothetical protein
VFAMAAAVTATEMIATRLKFYRKT